MPAAGYLLRRSGEKAPSTGLYLSPAHYHEDMRLEILRSAGDALPKCPECDEELVWNFVGEYKEDTIERERPDSLIYRPRDELVA